MVVAYGFVLAVMAAGYGVLFSMLDDYRDEYGIGEGALGAVIGIGFIAGFLAQAFIAPLADRGHARALVLGGMALDIVGVLLMAVATDFVPLMAGRFVMGVGAGMAVPAVRRIVINAYPDQLGHNLGRLLAAEIAGFATGPALSALMVGTFGIPSPFLLIAAVTIVAFPFVAARPVVEEDTEVRQRLAFDLLRLRPFAGAVVIGCAVWMMIGAFDALWVVVLDDLDTNEWVANVGIVMFALPLVVLSSVGGRLAQRVGPFRVGTVGLLLGAGYMLLYGLVPTGTAMFVVAMFHSLSDGLTMSSTGVAVGLVVPAERQAGAQGVLGGMQTLVAGVAAPLIGVVYEQAGRRAAYTLSATLMLVFLAAGVALARPAWSIRGRPTVEPSGRAPAYEPG